jgi:secondary thiamine-phosphate synthase enzyme
MRQATHTLSISTRGKGLYAFTEPVVDWVGASGMQTGLLTLYVKHTSASLLIQENYDPDVQTDMARFFARLVPDGDPIFEHTMEGPDDMPAHVRAALTQTSVSIPVLQGAPALGTWQGIYLFEHRVEPQRRQVVLHLIGD